MVLIFEDILVHKKSFQFIKLDGIIIGKNCSKCNIPKALGEFSSGWRCKICISDQLKHRYKIKGEQIRQRVNSYRIDNRDTINQKKRDYGKRVSKELWWKNRHSEKRKKQSKSWRNKNSDHVKDYNKKYKKENEELCRSISSERQNRKRCQQKLTKHTRKEAQEVFKKMRALNKIYGPRTYNVDHIIPLHNDNICGLHCPVNFQIITQSENSSKNDKWDGTYDNESWREDYE